MLNNRKYKIHKASGYVDYGCGVIVTGTKKCKKQHKYLKCCRMIHGGWKVWLKAKQLNILKEM